MVVCFAGDGDFLMSGQELATAVQESAAIVVLLVNNGMYGTIRMHQERHFPGASSAPTSSTPTSPRSRSAYGALLRSASSAPQTSPTRSNVRSRRSGPRCSTCGSIPKRSRRAQTLSEIRAGA